MKMILLPLLGAACLMLPSIRGADLGIPAPALSVAEWIKGEPIILAQGRGKNIYVVEFWATWCAPCRQTIPHLTTLQKRYAGTNVVFVGISDESPETIKPFVTTMGDEMGYRVAADQDKKTTAAYMQAFGVDGIPHAFVVDKTGTIVWHGHPLGGLERVIDDLLAGKHSVAIARSTRAVETLMYQYFMGATAGQSAPELTALGEKILAEGSKVPDLMHQFSFAILNEKRLAVRQPEMALRAARMAYDHGNPDAVLAQTYAQALAANRQNREAVKVLEAALKTNTDDRSEAKLKELIARYRAENK